MAGPIPISAPAPTGQAVQSPLLYQQLNQANSKNGYDPKYASSLGQMWNQYMGQGNTAGADQVHQAANAYRDMNGMAGTYNTTTGASLPKTTQAVGNPNSVGMNQPSSSQNQGYSVGNSPIDQQFYNQFLQYNGAPSSAEITGIQNQVNDFQNNRNTKLQANYNDSLAHAQSGQQYANQQASDTYNRAQQGLQTDSFLNYLKGQNELGSRGLGMTGGAFDDLGARTSLEYQRQLAGLYNNLQTAQMQAQRQYGDAQFSAQQALQNGEDPSQAEQLYHSLYNDLMTQRGRQAQAASSMYNTNVSKEEAQQQAMMQQAYNYAKLNQDQQLGMMKYYTPDANTVYKGGIDQQANVMKYMGVDPTTGKPTLDMQKLYADLTGTDPFTGKPTDTSALNWAKANAQNDYWKGMVNNGAERNKVESFRAQSDDAYHQALVGLDQQKVNQEGRKISDQEKQWVGNMQDKGLQRQASGVQSTLNNVRSQISSLMGKLESATPEDKPMIQQQIAQLQAQETMQKNALDHILNQDPSQSNPDMSGFPADATPSSSFSNFLPNL